MFTTQSIRCVLFDLDGTLLDTAPDFVHVVNRLLNEHNKNPLPAEIIRSTVSDGARALITLAFGINEGEDGFEQLKARLLELYENHLSEHTTAFDGIDTLLHTLESRNIKWGVVTNKPSRYTIPLLERLNFSDRCATIVCPDHVTHTKPHPEPMLLACKQAGSEPHNTIYVGDHERDIRAGHNAGMATVAALYGYIDKEHDWKSWQATHHVHHASEILDWFELSQWQCQPINKS